MHHASTPSGGQPENLKAGTPAKPRSGTLRMSVHIPEGWNPHADLLAIADLARDLCQRSDHFRDKAREILRALDAEDCPNEDDAQEALAEASDLHARAAISAESVREINFAACLLAMRLSACTITLPASEAEQEGGAL
jgi:hypothetical protein